MRNEIICIVCPVGCRLLVDKELDGEIMVEGNKCPRGKTYAIKEMTNPTRPLTSTVAISDGILNRLPVRTDGEIPKSMIYDCMKALCDINLNAPIKMGEIIINNILNTNVNIISSRTMNVRSYECKKK